MSIVYLWSFIILNIKVALISLSKAATKAVGEQCVDCDDKPPAGSSLAKVR